MSGLLKQYCGRLPALPGSTVLDAISHMHASYSASYLRCAAVRMSSGPARFPSDSSTARPGRCSPDKHHQTPPDLVLGLALARR